MMMEAKKLVHLLLPDTAGRNDEEEENRRLAKQLADQKLKIRDAERWDRFKKASNDYELVYTTCYGLPSVAAVNPVSRSYFKMWEMLVDFGPELLASSSACADLSGRQRVLFLAEGPGGFVQAYADFRKWRQGDELHAMTLRPTTASDRVVPRWKVTRPAGALTMHWGADGTGDLCQLPNLQRLAEECGLASFDLITADGGFDFSSDFNAQEAMCVPLIAAEALCALRMQRPGGAFVLKVFDTFSGSMMRVLQALFDGYERVRLVKPLTSRPANSEKYVVCTGRRRQSPHQDRKAQAELEALIQGQELPLQDAGGGCTIRHSVTEFNRRYTSLQMGSIERTLSMSEGAWTHLGDQISLAASWCRKYGVPSSV